MWAEPLHRGGVAAGPEGERESATRGGLVAEILIYGSQPILDPCIKILWTLANFMARFMAAQNWPEILP